MISQHVTNENKIKQRGVNYCQFWPKKINPFSWCCIFGHHKYWSREKWRFWRVIYGGKFGFFHHHKRMTIGGGGTIYVAIMHLAIFHAPIFFTIMAQLKLIESCSQSSNDSTSKVEEILKRSLILFSNRNISNCLILVPYKSEYHSDQTQAIMKQKIIDHWSGNSY